MKYSLLCALLTANAFDLSSEDHVDLQIGTDARARSSVRDQLRQQLRTALYRGDGYPEIILPNGTPVLPIPSSDPDVYAAVQLDAEILDDEMTVENARQQAAMMQA